MHGPSFGKSQQCCLQSASGTALPQTIFTPTCPKDLQKDAQGSIQRCVQAFDGLQQTCAS